jgi:hypothetical protein
MRLNHLGRERLEDEARHSAVPTGSTTRLPDFRTTAPVLAACGLMGVSPNASTKPVRSASKRVPSPQCRDRPQTDRR